jgi:hypothetical protein
MKTLLKLVFFLSFAAVAQASTTWYVRTDGGDQTQCTGKGNAAYPGSGTAQACAYNHPFWLLDQNAWTWLPAGGDTIQFADKGPYYLGLGPFKGLGMNWNHCYGNAPDCYMPPPPSGTASAPTRILGANAGQCGTNYTMLSGIHGIFWMFTVQGTNWVDMECLEFTQPDPCTKVGLNTTNITSTQMSGGVATYGWTKGYYNPPKVGEPVTITGTTNGGGVFNVTNKIIASLTGSSSGTFTITGLSGDFAQQAESASSDFAGYCNAQTQNFASNGLVFAYLGNQGPSNFTIKDLYIHGIAGDGTLGSHFNTTASDTFNASNIRIFGNGLAGFDSDGGGCSTNCESIGTMNLTNLDVEWNGCIQISPGIYNFCVDQAYGGNGDNLVMIATGGTWNWNHITTKFGMQDCFDSLHTGDDPNNLPTINTTYMYTEGCEGAAIKMGGGNMVLRNSVGISNCQVMLTASNFPNNLPGWNSFVGSPCRGNDSFLLAISDGHTLTIQNVDNIGQQDVGWDIVPTANGCNGACVIIFQNNTSVGYLNTASGKFMSGIYYDFPVDPFSNPSSRLTNNNWFNIRSGCPISTYEMNAVCGDPLFVAEANVNHIDPHLTSKSPLIGAGIYVSATSPDYDGDIRPTTSESIGFDEYASAPPIPSSGNPTTISGNTCIGGTTVTR